MGEPKAPMTMACNHCETKSNPMDTEGEAYRWLVVHLHTCSAAPDTAMAEQNERES